MKSVAKASKRKDYCKVLSDIVNEQYENLTDDQTYDEVLNILKNNWLSGRVEMKLLALKAEMEINKNNSFKKT